MTSVILALSFAFLSFAGTTLSLYPYEPYQPIYLTPVKHPYQPPQPKVLPPANQAPTYLVYPNAVYKLANSTNPIQPHDFVFGARGPQDKLLMHTTIFKRPGIWSSYASKELTFPPPGSPIRVNVTEVNAFDRGKNGTGGFVKMVRGGIGKNNVTLLFRSQKNRPINFQLDIYGIPRR